MIILSRSHFFLEFRLQHDFPEDAVGCHQNVLIVKENVIDPGYSFIAQICIVHVVCPPEERHVEGKMHVMVHVGSRCYQPVHEPVIHKGNNCGWSQTGRRQRTCNTQSDRNILLRVFIAH